MKMVLDEIEKLAEEYACLRYEKYVGSHISECWAQEYNAFLAGHSAAKEEVERLKGIISKHAQDLRDQGVDKVLSELDALKKENEELRSANTGQANRINEMTETVRKHYYEKDGKLVMCGPIDVKIEGLYEQIIALKANIETLRDDHMHSREVWEDTLARRQAHINELKQEIEVLRLYGNSTTIGMADEALERLRL
jgi:ribosomal protein L29